MNEAEARQALKDSAQIVGAVWLSFVFFALYIAVTVGTVTHKQLFLETPILLPVIGTSLPLVAYFWVSPILLIIAHAYFLLHFSFMASRAHRYLHAHENSKEPIGESELNIPHSILAEFLFKNYKEPVKIFTIFLFMIAWISCVFGPLIILALVQITFLPYQDSITTWIHRIYILLDIIVVAALWPRIQLTKSTPPKITRVMNFGFLMLLLFSWAIATFPGEFHDRNFISKMFDNALPQWVGHCQTMANCDPITFSDALFSNETSEATGRRLGLFANALALADETLIDVDRTSDVSTETGTKDFRRQSLLPQSRGRHFRAANFQRADLRTVDFRGALLDGADFSGANLRKATFGATSAMGTDFTGADLAEATITQSSFAGSSLRGTNLSEALIEYTHLYLVDGSSADFRGSQIINSNLSFSSFYNSSFEASHLEVVNLICTDLRQADFEITSNYQVDFRGVRVNEYTIVDGGLFFSSNLSKVYRILEREGQEASLEYINIFDEAKYIATTETIFSDNIFGSEFNKLRIDSSEALTFLAGIPVSKSSRLTDAEIAVRDCEARDAFQIGEAASSWSKSETNQVRALANPGYLSHPAYLSAEWQSRIRFLVDAACRYNVDFDIVSALKIQMDVQEVYVYSSGNLQAYFSLISPLGPYLPAVATALIDEDNCKSARTTRAETRRALLHLSTLDYKCALPVPREGNAFPNDFGEECYE